VSRGVRFIWVGVGGFIVQGAALQGLVSLTGLPYPVATALAVEAAILHNFLWHERWTWADRVEAGRASRRARFLRFNGATAFVSIGGNVVLMSLLVGVLHLPLLAAMTVAVVAMSAVNFVCADRFVFTQ